MRFFLKSLLNKVCFLPAILEALECCRKWWSRSYRYCFCFEVLDCWLKLTSDALHLCFAGVLEANFVEPAHDKQGFERTTVLARLESRLIQMQKNYWFVFLASHLTITSFTCKADILLSLLMAIFLLGALTVIELVMLHGVIKNF